MHATRPKMAIADETEKKFSGTVSGGVLRLPVFITHFLKTREQADAMQRGTENYRANAVTNERMSHD